LECDHGDGHDPYVVRRWTGVDAINTFGVSAGGSRLFCVVSRSQIRYFRSSRRFMRLVRFPAAPQRKMLAVAGSFLL
jgi:poly(3-hydroxyalkanoate) synthetase